MVAVKTEPGIKAPERAITKEAPKIPNSKTILLYSSPLGFLYYYIWRLLITIPQYMLDTAFTS
jgi:hypothetical protein